MIFIESSDKVWTIDDPSKDQILQWGQYVPYNESDNPEEYVVLHEYVFWSARLESIITVPRWFVTDLASIPKVARIVVTKSGKTKLPALAHDVLYFMHAHYPDQVTYTRKDADLVLEDFCKFRGMSNFISSLVYCGVRIGGSKPFNSAKDAFLPLELRQVYINRFPIMDLNPDNGKFDIV